ncbi:MAG TPA: hypothetical protein DCP28_01660 [Cytophagales bacterium]|nr:hypothetical protein [Cytophagales bacterium]
MKDSWGWIALLTCLALPTWAHAQKATLSGYIKDAETGEALVGASILVLNETGKGVVTNVYGFYSLTLPAGEYDFQVRYVGYTDQQFTLNLNQSITRNIDLAPAQTELAEVVITSVRPEDNVQEVKMSRETLPIERVRTLPALLGEVDVLRTVQLLPGVTSAGEGTTGLFVRGGSADQNLITLDEATVYNPGHFLGFFSVFSPDAVKNLELYKGGIPAKYGGRVSSVVDVQMKEGNNKKYVVNGGVGLISSRLTIEGPIVKDRASFIISGRRTYADAVLRVVPSEVISWFTEQDPELLKENVLYFYDLTAKANATINDRNRLFLSGYFGRDVLTSADLFGFNWGNQTFTARWNHLFSDQLFSNLSFIQTDYDYGVDVTAPTQSIEWSSGLKEIGGKADFTWFAHPSSTIEFGGSVIYHTFLPGTFTTTDTTQEGRVPDLQDRFAWEYGAYVSNDHKVNDWLALQYGVRWSGFENIGPGDVRTYREGSVPADSTVLDTLTFADGERIQWYQGLEPRFAARILVNSLTSIKLSYNRTRQYLQIASNSTAGLPIDRWVPADRYIKPIIADQVAVGYFQNFADNTLEGSVEVYYKWLQNVIDFRPDAQILLSNTLETELFEGCGWAYGIEFQLKKQVGQTTGWISYTLAKTQRQNEFLNGGNPYNARYDRTHDFSIVATHEFNDQWTFSGTWVYATSPAVSLPEGSYEIDGQTVAYYDPLKFNAYRMPAYHRLDLSATWNVPQKREEQRWKSSWNFSVYNAYARQNIFSLEFRDIYNEDIRIGSPPREITSQRPGTIKTFLFSIIPSFTYNFTF